MPYRHVYDCYRLPPRHTAIREPHRLGVQLSFLKRFPDGSEAATRHGKTVRRHAARGSRTEARYRSILQRCQAVGYLEYVCPQCERTLEIRKNKRERRPGRTS
ncbi:MAG: hypothetical protein OXC18_13855 [Desulfurellaceae bacterium]|nr:hypothetical protein [Desulfurellaceae bacterium]